MKSEGRTVNVPGDQHVQRLEVGGGQMTRALVQVQHLDWRGD